jgi:putative DNA primase/helicase
MSMKTLDMSPKEMDVEYAAMNDRAHSNGANASPNPDGASWPEPVEIRERLPEVPPFEPELLPASFRAWVADIAERSQCPPDFLAIGAIVTCASLIARRVAIRPKREDDWTVVPNLWGGVIAPPGFLKTPALAETLKPLNRLAYKAARVFEDEKNIHEANLAALKIRREGVEQAMRVAVKKKAEGELAALTNDLTNLTVKDPHEARFLVNDVTVEKLGELLNQNPGGLLIFRDELSGFLRSLERQGHEADRAFYCEAWNGNSRFSYDRIGRGTIHIERACVSILGGIQPGPWRNYICEIFSNGQDDGFVSRFQLLVWPDVSRDWRNVDRWPNGEAKEKVWQIVTALAGLDPLVLGVTPEVGALPFMRFTPEAQNLFDEWREDLEVKVRDENQSPILMSHLAKYRKLMPALALILHAIEAAEKGFGTLGTVVPGVSLAATQKGAAWCDYLEAHAKRCYQSVIDPGPAASVALAQKVRSSKLPNPFKARDVYRCHWADLRTRDDVESAAAVLEAAHWLCSEPIATDPQEGGRPSTRYWINPKLLEGAK